MSARYVKNMEQKNLVLFTHWYFLETNIQVCFWNWSSRKLQKIPRMTSDDDDRDALFLQNIWLTEDKRCWPFKCQPHKMVRTTQANFLSVFDRFVGLALKGLSQPGPLSEVLSSANLWHAARGIPTWAVSDLWLYCMRLWSRDARRVGGSS